MKTALLAALLALPAAASATPEALQQLQECAQGRCWDTKGQPVTAVPQGAVLVREPSRVRPMWDKRPAEPPRYTVLTKEEVSAARRRQQVVGTALAGAMGAAFGAMLGGAPGAIAGGLLAAGAAYLFFRLTRKG